MLSKRKTPAIYASVVFASVLLVFFLLRSGVFAAGPVKVCVGDGGDFTGAFTLTTASTPDQIGIAQTFTTDGSGFYLDAIKLPLVEEQDAGEFNQEIYVEIRTTSAGDPTFTILWYATIEADTLFQRSAGLPHQTGDDFKCEATTAPYEILIPVNPALQLTAGTTYAVVVRCSLSACVGTGQDAAEWIVYGQSAIAGSCFTSTDGSTTWSSAGCSGTVDIQMALFGNVLAPTATPTPTPSPTPSATPTPTRTPIPVKVSPTAGLSGVIDQGNVFDFGTTVWRFLLFLAVIVGAVVFLATRKRRMPGWAYIATFALVVFVALIGNLFQSLLATLILGVLFVVLLGVLIVFGRGRN